MTRSRHNLARRNLGYQAADEGPAVFIRQRGVIYCQSPTKFCRVGKIRQRSIQMEGGSHLRDEPAFDVFRDILRQAVLDLWPLAAGDSVFGHVLPERRIHSVVTAANELNVNPDRLRPLLVEANAIAADDHRPHARATFDAHRFAPLLASISELVPDGALRKALGATKAEMMALEQAGILIPAQP